MLGIGKHGKWSVWVFEIDCEKLAVVAAKGIGTSRSMLVKHFRSRAIVGHRYPIVSINFHEHVMTGMVVLR